MNITYEIKFTQKGYEYKVFKQGLQVANGIKPTKHECVNAVGVIKKAFESEERINIFNKV